jgi:hypothetical protein
MNTSNTKDTQRPESWFNPPIANGELPGEGAVTVGCYRSEDGKLGLVPVLTCYRVEETGKREQLDRVLVGPTFVAEDPGFDLLRRAYVGFTRLFSDAVELPRPPADENQLTELVLVVGPSKDAPEWVAVGVWDNRCVQLVGYPYRDEGDNVCRWLWQSDLPHVTAYAAPAEVSEELDWAWPPLNPLPWPWPEKKG